MIYTTRTPAYDAKNRHNLPPAMPLSATAFFDAVRAFQSMNTADQIKALIPTLKTETLKSDALGALGRAGSNEAKLALVLNWVRENL